jgi:hypothetical protein
MPAEKGYPNGRDQSRVVVQSPPKPNKTSVKRKGKRGK